MKNRKSHLVYEFYFTINLNSKFINNNNNINNNVFHEQAVFSILFNRLYTIFVENHRFEKGHYP